MVQSFRVAMVLCLSTVVMGGCVSISRQYEGPALSLADLEAVEVGKTTRQQVLDSFGPPAVIQKRDFEGLVSAIGSGFQGEQLTVVLDPSLMSEVFLYEYRQVNRYSIVLILFNYFSSNDKSDRLMFFFGPDGMLAGYGLSEGTKEL